MPFLYLDIYIVVGKFVYKLYEERDSFPFFFVKISHFDNNIPDDIFYSVIGACSGALRPELVEGWGGGGGEGEWTMAGLNQRQ